MEWKKLDKYVLSHRMLWMHEDGSWFAGKFSDDLQFGQSIETDEGEHIKIEKITHYMIIEKP